VLLPIERRANRQLRGCSNRAKAYGVWNDYIHPSAILRMLKKQGRQCALCKCILYVSTFTIDHTHPLSLGGAHSLANIQLACADCNTRKHAKTDWKPTGLRNFSVLKLAPGETYPGVFDPNLDAI
jgi:5-methylcytosine-specific restriction endonuclease McrA